jgi:hypothetical protein
MPDVGALSSHETVPVKFHDVTIQVQYDPSAATAELSSKAERYGRSLRAPGYRGKDKFPVPELRFILADVVKAWDLTRDGQPYPIDVVELAKLPTPLLRAISDAILENESPKPESGGSFEDS